MSSQQQRARPSLSLLGLIDWEKNGIFFSNGIARDHVSLLQSQNIAWNTWIKYFGTGTKLIVSSKYHYY